MVALSASAIIVVVLAGSCTGSTTRGASGSPETSTQAGSPTTPSARPVTDYASFLQGLRAAGFTVREKKPVMNSGLFGVPVRLIAIDGETVSTYEYPSEAALADVAGGISHDGYSVPTVGGGVAIVEWIATPHLFSSGRLLVVYVGDDAHILDALRLFVGRQFAGG